MAIKTLGMGVVKFLKTKGKKHQILILKISMINFLINLAR